MAKYNVKYTRDNEYYTPKEFVKQFGNFDYDPATTPEKAVEFNIKHYDTIKSNGLNSHWENYQRIWCNPPFTIKHLFFKKAIETIEKNPNTMIMFLVPIEFLTTKRFHQIIQNHGYVVFIPNGRIKFESGVHKKDSSVPFGSVVLRLGREKDFGYKRLIQHIILS